MLRPYGFEPSNVSVTAGLVHIRVYNRVGKPELDLSLEREATRDTPAVALRTDVAPRELRRWSDLRQLAPGVYTLRETSNPKWTCTITVGLPTQGK